MRVLISGGGVAGPALAHWLNRSGMEVTVVERAQRPRPGGHAVDIRGVAKIAVERMGILPAVVAERTEEHGLALVNANGKRTAELPSSLFGGDGIVAEIEIARGDLARILTEAAPVEWRYGDRITDLTQDDNGVDVRFATGLSERYDIVVGADGVHSGVRGLAFGPDSDYVHFLGAYNSYFTVPDPGDLQNWFEMFNAPGGFVAGMRPERGGTAKASLSFRHPSPEFARLPQDRAKTLLAEQLANVGWRVPEMLAALPSAPDFFFDSIDQVHVENWSRGRIVLLGDAGYCGSPLAGMGTSMSLVGAYVLAHELVASSDPRDAFAAYQRRMALYVKQNTQLPPGGIDGFAPTTALRIRMRAFSMRSMSRWPGRVIAARMFSKADAIELPELTAPPARSL